MEFNTDMFNWDSAQDNAAMSLAGGKKVYETDDRFYVLPKNEKKEGIAIIRLLPDAEGKKFTTMFKIGTTVTQNGQKRFMSEYSPASIGLPCPFQERWAELYNADRKDEAKVFSRNVRYVSNVKVIKDPLKPENEGKIFLYDMSGSLKDKFQMAMEPSAEDLALGTQPKQMFNPLQGHNIKLVAKIGANGQTNYDSTEIVAEVSAIYSSPEEAVADVKGNTYLISKELQAPEKFRSYDDLVEKLKWVTFQDGPKAAAVASVTTQAPVAAPVETAPAESAPASQAQTDLDNLLAGIM